jgi:hypothetical protein
MNRDDKAHRFVVTWNAFLDGNRLAYLALILAIGVDALVFMSGLFGAQALRSPLSDVPSPKARSAHQLEAIIEAALLPDTFKNARLALAAMHPREPIDGFTNEVRLRELDPESAAQVRDVLNAGATIGAVRQVDSAGHYLVRSELHTFLSDVIKRELRRKPEETQRGLGLDRLEKRIREALMPHVLDTSDAVLKHLHPIDEVKGFTSEIFLNEVEPDYLRPVRNLLTAGSSLRVVARGRNNESGYLIHADLYTTLARIRARELAVASYGRRPLEGGALGSIAIGSRRELPLLGHSPRPNGAATVSDDDIRAQCRHALLAALALTPAALEKIAAPEIAGEAMAAANVLRQQARAHQGLNNVLKLLESDNNRAVEGAYQALAIRYEGNDHALELLDETAKEIGQLIPALMLLPEGGLANRFVGELEEAYDGLTNDELVLLSRLRKLKEELETMNPQDASAWKRIAQRVSYLNHAGPQAAAATGESAGSTKH